jgi:hypothetical protein
MATDPTQIGAPSTAESTAITNKIIDQIQNGTYGQNQAQTTSPSNTSAALTIRNVSQTTQEREIIKTAPDVVVFIDGLPYLTNPFVNDPRTLANYTLVNFNDNVTSFSASYDTESLVPNCSIQLQVPNYEKYLYQMPGGNNLLQTMAQVQVYAKSYYMAATGDTIYRRVFKGVTSFIGYNDNGKTLEVTIQCHGILHLLEKMQINLHPSTVSSHKTGARQTIYQSILASGDCFQVLAALFTEAFHSDGFQIASIQSSSQLPGQGTNTTKYYDAIHRGYMAKWQAILYNMVKDVHIFGPYKDNLGNAVVMKKDGTWGKPAKNTLASSIKKRSTVTESEGATTNDSYYGQIQTYAPYRIITSLDFSNSMIVNRLDAIREVVRRMDFEAYQDIDGKVIIKPPLYNLDVVNLGQRLKQTSTALNSSKNSYTNPATAIYENNNPFIIHLSEILTEQESEDQSAIRRTRTTISGNASKSLAVQNWREDIKPVGEYIDVTKLAKFGLREEPMYNVPWIAINSKMTLFAHAVAETVRANRGYRTYTITIPLRPELKLGFPVFIPHKDMYAYIKSISLNYNVGGTATMTLTCDSVRRRVMVNTPQTQGSGNSTLPQSLYTSAPNLVIQWTKNPSTPTSTDPSQSPSNAEFWENRAQLLSQGKNGGVSAKNANKDTSQIVGTSQTLSSPARNPDGSTYGPTPEQLKVQSNRDVNIGNSAGNQTDAAFATYVVKNDGNKNQGTIDPVSGVGYFTQKRIVDLSYLQVLTGSAKSGAPSTIPYTDEKGYEVMAPFPWGRWQTLNAAIREFTELGFITPPTDVNGNFTEDLEDQATFSNAQAFVFAGLGTPTTTNDPSTQLITAVNQQISAVGGSNIATQTAQTGATNPATGKSTKNTSPTVNYAQQKNFSQPDATVIILTYDPSQSADFANNKLLSQSQPENAFAEQQLLTTQSSAQQLVDVLVSGRVAPIPAVQEQLLATQTQLPNGNITLISHPPKNG